MKPANPVDKYMVAIKKNNVVVGHLLLVSRGNIVSPPPPPTPTPKIRRVLVLEIWTKSGS